MGHRTNFTILHVSDLHLEDPGAFEQQRDRFLGAGKSGLARLIAAKAKELSESLDLILVTGDLTESGSEASLRYAQSFIDGSSSFFREFCLRSSGVQTLVLPGNHDRFTGGMGLRKPGSKSFDYIFEVPGYWRVGQGVCRALVKPRHESGAKLAVVMADLTLRPGYQGSFSKRLGRGRVYEDVLEKIWLETLTAKQRDDATVVWATHFAPGEIEDENLHLEEWQTLIDLGEKLGVPAIFCGHIHQAQTYFLPHEKKSIAIIQAGAGAAGRPVHRRALRKWAQRNSIQAVTLGIEEGAVVEISIQLLTWNNRKREFVPGPVFELFT